MSKGRVEIVVPRPTRPNEDVELTAARQAARLILAGYDVTLVCDDEHTAAYVAQIIGTCIAELSDGRLYPNVTLGPQQLLKRTFVLN